MPRLVILVLSLALLTDRALAQDTAGGAENQSRIDKLNDLQRALAAQQAQIDELKWQAQQRERILQKMQQQVEEGLIRAQATAAAVSPPGIALASLVIPGTPTPAPSQEEAPPPTSTPIPRVPAAVLKISDSVSFRFSVILQPAYEAAQDPSSSGTSQNFYLRRARFFVQGLLGPDVMVFLQTDDARLGYAGATGAKNITSGFTIIDAFAQWNFLGNALGIQAGEMIVPTVRQIGTAVPTSLSLDIPTWVLQQSTALGENSARDYGVGLIGYTLDGRLSYRVGVYDGNRIGTNPQPPPLGPAAGSRNPPRVAGRVMYDFFDPEVTDPRLIKGNFYRGTFLGQEKILALGLVGDGQGDYKGFGGDVFFNWPLGPGSVTAEADYMHYDGHEFYANSIPKQWTLFANAGYFVRALKLQPFLRYEKLDYDLPANEPKEQSRIGGGANYYILGFNLKVTGYFERIVPKVQPPTATIKDLNRFVMMWTGFF